MIDDWGNLKLRPYPTSAELLFQRSKINHKLSTFVWKYHEMIAIISYFEVTAEKKYHKRGKSCRASDFNVLHEQLRIFKFQQKNIFLLACTNTMVIKLLTSIFVCFSSERRLGGFRFQFRITLKAKFSDMKLNFQQIFLFVLRKKRQDHLYSKRYSKT